jgi:hypothetical protein
MMYMTSRHSTTANRRHQSPLCTCSDCAFFDQSATLYHPSKEGVIMTALDTETGERFTYYYHQGVLHRMPVSRSTPRALQKKDERKHSFRILLHDLVIGRIEKSVQAHPFFWLCISTLFRSDAS